jgi:hypothetical protein
MKFERFVKKPVVVDVIQYQGVVIDFLKNDMRIKWNGDDLKDDAISIHTVDGIEVCHNGDYIIKGSQGELYPCSACDLERDYDKAPLRKKRTSKNVDDVFEASEKNDDDDGDDIL